MKAWMMLGLLAMGAFMTATWAADDADLKGGLVAQVWDMGGAVEEFPTIPADKKPTVKKVDAQINVDTTGDEWPGTNLKEHYFIRWTGVIRIAKDAQYKFFLASDDGSRLFIDGKQVVDNGGLHATEEKDGQVDLKAGDHEIKVEFFQNEGEAACKLSWQAGDGAKDIVPASALFHKKSAE